MRLDKVSEDNVKMVLDLWDKLTKEEHNLNWQLHEFEERYFKEFMLNSFKNLMTYYEHYNGKFIKFEDQFDPDLRLGLHDWWVKLENLEDMRGECDGNKKTISIEKALSKENRDIVLLHEMIHAFEFKLQNHPDIRDLILLHLYLKLNKKIKSLYRLIKTDSHVIHKEHSPLFLLKSLDLDLEFEKKLGTIYGYGREEFHWEISNIEQAIRELMSRNVET